MDKRQEELTKLKTYIEGIDNELSMILQNLQWDRKHLKENPVMVTCRYDSNHKVPSDKSEEHEKDCFLKQNGYTKDDCLLPDPLDSESSTLVKLSKEDIVQIIENAARSDQLFKKGVGCCGVEPMSLERLQSSYSTDERRAIHDAVVSAVPSCHDLTDLALFSGGDEQGSKVILSRMEILAELRNMRRRRAKYRVAAKTRNYSDVLRDVIKTQMEHYTDAHSETGTKDTLNEQVIDKQTDKNKNSDHRNYKQLSREDDRRRYEHGGRDSSRHIVKIEVNTERDDSTERIRDYGRERSNRARYEERHRERHDRDRDRHRYKERSRDKRNDNGPERDRSNRERSVKRRCDENYGSDDKYSKRTREIKQEPKYRGYDDEPDGEYYNSEDRSRRSDKYRDNDRERRYKERSKTHKERSRERRCDEDPNRNYKHKDRTRTCDDNLDRDRRGSPETDYRYRERSSERLYIKQEREDSITTDDRSKYERYNSEETRHRNNKRNVRSYRESSYDSYSTEKSIKQEKYQRYYDSAPTDVIYDPNKKIKEEK